MAPSFLLVDPLSVAPSGIGAVANQTIQAAEKTMPKCEPIRANGMTCQISRATQIPTDLAATLLNTAAHLSQI